MLLVNMWHLYLNTWCLHVQLSQDYHTTLL